MTGYAFGMDTPITPDEIIRIGHRLYGPSRGWKKLLAKRLGARQETISRWLRGRPVSNPYARLLRSLK